MIIARLDTIASFGVLLLRVFVSFGLVAHGYMTFFVEHGIVASPVVLTPAMNDRMWANPIVQGNVATLKQHGFTMVGPGEGWLACRSIGPGRMAEADEILDAVTSKL